MRLPPDLNGGLVMGQMKINVQTVDVDMVGGSMVSLGMFKTGPNEMTAQLVCVGGVSREQYLAAQMMPYFLSRGEGAEEALAAAKTLIAG